MKPINEYLFSKKSDLDHISVDKRLSLRSGDILGCQPYGVNGEVNYEIFISEKDNKILKNFISNEDWCFFDNQRNQTSKIEQCDYIIGTIYDYHKGFLISASPCQYGDNLFLIDQPRHWKKDQINQNTPTFIYKSVFNSIEQINQFLQKLGQGNLNSEIKKLIQYKNPRYFRRKYIKGEMQDWKYFG